MSTIGTDPEYSFGNYVKSRHVSEGKNLMYMSDKQRLAYWGYKTVENMEASEKRTNANVKRCSRCGLVKDISNFGRHPKSKDGYMAECKSCRVRKNAVTDQSIDKEVREMISAIPQQMKNEASTAERLTDKALADELRRRGDEVKATKTIEI